MFQLDSRPLTVDATAITSIGTINDVLSRLCTVARSSINIVFKPFDIIVIMRDLTFKDGQSDGENGKEGGDSALCVVTKNKATARCAQGLREGFP